MDQQQLSAHQFGTHAANYLTSPVHATGADLERLAALATAMQPARALDLGCGAGHASFALARGGAARVTAYDPSAAMLEVAKAEAQARGHAAIETRQGSAEQLPFEAGTFELVVSRFSAHHWASVPRALGECGRVLVPGGRLVFIDVVASDVPFLDTVLQVLEFLRDPSHVRDYRRSEWRQMFHDAGFTAPTMEGRTFRSDFDAWIARIGTSPERVAALRAVLADLPGDAVEQLQVEPNGSFVSEAAWIEATKTSRAIACHTNIVHRGSVRGNSDSERTVYPRGEISCVGDPPANEVQGASRLLGVGGFGSMSMKARSAPDG